MFESAVRPGRRLRPAVAATLAAIVAVGCASVSTETPTPLPRQALAAGDYRSTGFTPAVSFTLPDGWLILEDSAEYLALQPVTSDAVGIFLFRSPGAASQQADCPTTALPEIGPMAKDLVDWIRARPGLRTGSPESVVLGGSVGFELDVAIVDGWTASCPFAGGLPAVPLFVGASNDLRWVIAGSERLMLRVLDVPGGGTVVVDIDAFEGPLLDGFLPVATPIVKSLRFAMP